MKGLTYALHFVFICFAACIIVNIWTVISEINQFIDPGFSDPIERAMAQTMSHFSIDKARFKIALYSITLLTTLAFWVKRNKFTFLTFSSVAIPVLISKLNFIFWNVFAARFDSPYIKTTDIIVIFCILSLYPLFLRYQSDRGSKIVVTARDFLALITGIVLYSIIESFALQWPR